MSVDVTNTGARDGDEVAQLYLSSSISVPMPVCEQLRGFKRLSPTARESKTVAIGPLFINITSLTKEPMLPE